MNLVSVAARFDTAPMWDAYTGEKLKGKCQLTLWDNPRRDGLTTLRRTISIADGVELPARRAVVISKQAWIVGDQDNSDAWGGEQIRRGFIAQMAILGTSGTTEEMIDESAEPMYLCKVWVKDVKDISDTSEGQGQYFIYYLAGEKVYEGEFILAGGRWHIVRNIIQGVGGFLIAEVNELEVDCVVDVMIKVGDVFDPVTEKYTGGTTYMVRGISSKYKDDYDHKLPSFTPEEAGDLRIRFKSSDAYKFPTNSRLTIKSDVWQVVSRHERPSGDISVVVRRV